MTRVCCACLLVFALSGCARLTGLPSPEAQVRIFEGVASLRGGNVVTPARGDANGIGCVISQIGQVTARIVYHGARCQVTVPYAR